MAQCTIISNGEDKDGEEKRNWYDLPNQKEWSKGDRLTVEETWLRWCNWCPWLFVEETLLQVSGKKKREASLFHQFWLDSSFNIVLLGPFFLFFVFHPFYLSSFKKNKEAIANYPIKKPPTNSMSKFAHEVNATITDQTVRTVANSIDSQPLPH